MQNLDYQFCPMSLDEAWLAHDKRLVWRKAGNKHLIVKNRLIHARYGEIVSLPTTIISFKLALEL